MNKELEKVMIEDMEYSFDPDKEYIKDGHAYCKACHERKDGKALEFFGKQMIFKTACKCNRDREAKEKERQTCRDTIHMWQKRKKRKVSDIM